MTQLSSRMKALAGAMAASLVLYACGGGGYGGGGGGNGGSGFTANALTTDSAASGYTTTYGDANLVNAWGLVFNPQGFAWVADAATSKSTLYDGHGVPQSLVVSLPTGQAGAAMPTGIVFNGSSTEFMVSQGGVSGASAFVFAGLGGTVQGWSPNVNMTSAIIAFDGAASGSVYTGLAIAQQGSASFLYAADFANARIDVFDAGFVKTATTGGFADPNLPAGYAPFGIQAIGNRIYVAYAKVDPATHDEQKGAGLGVVDVFDTAGTLIKQLVAAGGALNAPWGIALAPAAFGAFDNALLVGNFGDGRINAYSPDTGAFLGTVSDSQNKPLSIDGLWGLAFGNGLNAQSANTLYFTAGPGDETHGLYGRIDAN